MAVGDVINGISAAATQYDFQPAVGVEIIVMCAGVYNNYVKFTNGIVESNVASFNSTGGSQNQAPKMPINNALYLRMLAGSAGQPGGWSGIQIK